jgi:2-haloacid dehalogenase
MVSAKPRALIFDAYGTLLDVHTVILRAGSGIEGDMEALSRLWRQKQVEATWLRALMERYVDFWHVTEEALRSAVRQLAIAATDAQIHRLMQSYRSPAAFAEVREALEACRGIPMAVRANGL